MIKSKPPNRRYAVDGLPALMRQPRKRRKMEKKKDYIKLSKFVQVYLSEKKVSSKTEQDEIIKFLLERNKITTEDIPKVRALLKIVSN